MHEISAWFASLSYALRSTECVRSCHLTLSSIHHRSSAWTIASKKASHRLPRTIILTTHFLLFSSFPSSSADEVYPTYSPDLVPLIDLDLPMLVEIHSSTRLYRFSQNFQLLARSTTERSEGRMKVSSPSIQTAAKPLICISKLRCCLRWQNFPSQLFISRRNKRSKSQYRSK